MIEHVRASWSMRAHGSAGMVAVLLTGVLIGGCGPKRTSYPQSLNSEIVEERIAAIQHAAEIGDRDVVPVLIDRLEDADEAVRFFAILAWDKLTGTREGYDYRAPLADRQRAVARWRRNTTPAPSSATQPAVATDPTDASIRSQAAPGAGGSGL